MQTKTYPPILNDTQYRFSTRDCLGIESVAASISAELCPIVNTVTPRAFYWPFMAWIYYDFYKNSGIPNRNTDTFDKEFLKHQDYFFVLSAIINNQPDQQNLVGKQVTSQDFRDNRSGPYSYNSAYFKTRYGGMQYYNAGCLTMQFITLLDEKNDKPFDFPRVTQFGEEMALAFEDVIKDTEYYKYYRLRNAPIPKDVLKEYGQIINIGLKGFDKCKRLLRHHLFETGRSESRRLRQCADYLQYIYSKAGKHTLDYPEARNVFYDYYSPRGLRFDIPEDLKQIAVGWEMVIGRQYLTCGIEMIWKYMLNNLPCPLSFEEWAKRVIESSSIRAVSNQHVSVLLKNPELSFNERELMITQARQDKVKERMVGNGLRVALSVYSRFRGRNDLGEAGALLDYGRGRIPGTGSLSFNEWISLVDQYRDKTIQEFLIHIMRSCIVDQHKRTCYDKMMRTSQSIDGFYFECVDDLYIRNEHEFQVDFQGIRMLQLMQVMKDLDMFEED